MPTNNHGYNTPDHGELGWGELLNENAIQLDTEVEIRDTDVNQEQYTPKDGALFRATDTGAVYLGDGSSWKKMDIDVVNASLTGTLDLKGTGSITNVKKVTSKGPVADIEAYGAERAKDGTKADKNATAIQQAVDKNDFVFIPPKGTFEVSSPVEVPSGTHIFSHGNQHGEKGVIRPRNTSAAFTHKSGATDKASFRGLWFDLGTGNGASGIEGDFHYCVFENNSFKYGSDGSDIHITTNDSGGVLNNRFRFNTHIGNGTQNHAIFTEYNTGDDEFYGNYIEKYAASGIRIRGYRNLIFGNHIHGDSDVTTGIHIDQSAHHRILMNHVGNTKEEAIRVVGGDTASTTGAYAHIGWNTFTNTNTSGNAEGIVGVTEQGYDYLQVVNNHADRDDASSTVPYFVYSTADSNTGHRIRGNTYEPDHVTTAEFNQTANAEVFNGPTDFDENALQDPPNDTTTDGMTADPESDTEEGYIEVEIEETTYQIPIYKS